MNFLACVAIGGGGRGRGGGQPLNISKTKNDLSMKLSSENYVSFVFIFCLFLCSVCVTWHDYDIMSMSIPCKLFKLDI